MKRKKGLSLCIAVAFLFLFLFPAGIQATGTRATVPDDTYTGLVTPSQKPDIEGMAKEKDSLNTAQKKLGSDLLALVEEDALPSATSRTDRAEAMQKQGQLTSGEIQEDGKGMLDLKAHVYIQLKPDADFSILNGFVSKIENKDRENSLVAAWVELSVLETLAAVDGVESIKTVLPPIVNTGSVTSEGDSVLQADLARVQSGTDGSGVKVGIISDGVDHYASSVATGDLPGDVTVLSNTVGGDEGTAMLEIVHDLAPGADLYFHDCGNNVLAFNAAIDDLVAAGCSVICDDIGWLGEPYFEDGVVGGHVKELVEEGEVVYVSSAGNAGRSHYQGEFSDDGYGYQDFSHGTSSYTDLYVNIPAGGEILVILEWNDPFGAAGNDYDLYLSSTDYENIYAYSQDVQNGTQDPIEAVYYENTSGAPIDAAIAVGNFDESAYKTLEVYIYGYGGAGNYTNNIVAADSIFGHPAVPGVIACGAVRASTPNTIETFSSQGPVTLLSETRQKPDVCGTDGVAVTGAGGFSNPFYGTSASAPHVAAIAALVRSKYTELDASQVKDRITGPAVDLGDAGFDAVYGSGRVNALGAVMGKPVPTAAPAGYDSVEVSWAAVPDVNGYEVCRTSSKGSVYARYTTAATSFTNTGRTTGTTYYYKVRAYCLVDGEKTYGNYSGVVSAKPVLATPVAGAELASYDSIRISWNAIDGASGYEMCRTSSSGSVYARYTTTSPGYTNTGRTPGTTYYYKVRAYRLVNGTKVYGSYSGLVSEQAGPATPAPAAAAAGYDSVEVSWNSIANADGYEVCRTSSKGSVYARYTTAETSFTNTGRTTGTTYYYKVRAYRLVNETKVYGDYSGVVSAKPVLGRPAAVAAELASPGSIQVSWNAVEGANGYEVCRTSSKGSVYARYTTAGTSFTNTGRTAGTTYYYKVRAYRLVNGTKVYGSYSGLVSELAGAGTPVPAAEAAGYDTIEVSWSAVADADGYEVCRTSSKGSVYARYTTAETSFTNTGRTAGTTYYYKVRAYRLAGGEKAYGKYSGVVSAKPVLGRPVAAAAPAGPGSIEVSWNAIDGADGYEVCRTSSKGSVYARYTTAGTSFTNTGRTAGTTYYYKVRAYRLVNGTKIYGEYSALVHAEAGA